MKRQKLIVILGPTATGKTKIATKLALKYQGEIISADSRQVYRGMDIGTGKDLSDYMVNGHQVPYHLIDIISPKTAFNVARYQKLAYRAIDEVLIQGRIPFLVGGTGLYIDAVTKGYDFSQKPSDVKSHQLLRQELDKLSLDQLLIKLKKVDLKTYKIIDQKNRRRVQRALEIYVETGSSKSTNQAQSSPYEVLYIGLKFPLVKIYQKIDQRLENRLEAGMINEVKKIRQQGASWKRLDDFGLEYRYVSRYLRGLIDHQTMLLELKHAIHHFAKRQLTWFKRNKAIVWVENLTAADQAIKKFLK